MTPVRRALPLRAVLGLLGLASLLFIAAVTVQVVLSLRPAATELRGRTRDLLSDHDQIGRNLTRLREARRQVARLAPPRVPSAEPLPDLRALQDTVRRLLDSSASMRASVERASIPVEMRLLLAQAVELETAVGSRLLEALRAIELNRPAPAVEALRASGIRSDSVTQLLSAAQRVALSDLLAGEELLLARLERLSTVAQRLMVVGLLLFAVGAWVIHTRFYRPVRSMEQAVQQVALGDLDAEAPVPRMDELGRLASHLNAMTHVLRDRAVEESRKRENLTERFGRILDESANQICVFDAETLRLEQANRGARVSLGYTREEMSALRLPDLIGGMDDLRLEPLLDSLRRGEQPQVILATWMKRKDGTLRPTEVSIQHAADGGSAVFITVAEDAGVRARVRELDERLRDFTLREQQLLTGGDLEAALHPLTKMAAEALGATRCGVWRVIGGDPRPLLAFDLRSGTHLTDATWPSDHGAGYEPLEAPVRTGGRVVATVVFEHAGEHRLWTPEERTFASAVSDLVLRAMDAAERRLLEQALERAQRMDSIGQLAGGVAHDFNNILTAILGNLEACRADLTPGDQMDEALAEAEQAALRAAELTRQLLTFARHQVVETLVVDVNERLRDAEPMLRRLSGAQVELETRLDPDVHHVRIGTGQLEQLAVNLVVNARDAMPEGGRVTLSTRNVTLSAREAAELPGLSAGPYVELRVTDTGVGMDERTLERVFEPFFTTKGLGEGTGLGLAVCYGVVRNAAGSISVTSRPGRGSTFRVFLPAILERPVVVPPPPRTPVEGGNEVILVAEDEPSIRMLVTRMLGARGYTVLAAEDGAQALEIAAAHDGPISLLISDVVMPRLGGPDTARRLRAQRPGLPVLFISGFTATSAVQEGDLSDAGFMAKPFTPDELGRRVRQMLDLAAGREPSSGPSGEPVAKPPRSRPLR